MSQVHTLIGSGGGGKAVAYIVVTYAVGFSCTCVKGSTILTAKRNEGKYIFYIPELGTWKVTVTNGSVGGERNVIVDTEGKTYAISISCRLPLAYQELSYLGSSGVQHINTGIPILKGYSIVADFSVTSSTNDLDAFGWETTNNLGIIANRYNPGFRILVGNAATGGQTSSGWSQSNKYHYEMSSDNSSVTAIFSSANSSFTIKDSKAINNTSIPLSLFGRAAGNGTVGNKLIGCLYCIAIANGSTKIAEYVPCYRKSDTIAGMYDLVSNTFKTNDGSGTFELGDEV